MLEEYKTIYSNQANLVVDWKNASKRKLCDSYLEAIANNDKQVAESYLAGIVCKYWKWLDKLYVLSPGVATPFLVHTWLIDGILYALNHHPWTDPANKLFKDKNGCDKCINRCIQCERLIHYQAINRQCRKSNFNNASIEEFKENGVDLVAEDNQYIDSQLYVSELVLKAFKKKEYFKSFFIDIVTNNSCLINGEFKDKKVLGYIKALDSVSATIFSNTYSLDYEEVYKAMKEISSMSNIKIHNRIKYCRNELKLSLLKEGSK